MNAIKGRSIRKKMMAAFTTASVGIVIASSLSVGQMSTRLLRREATASLEESSRQVQTTFESFLEFRESEVQTWGLHPWARALLTSTSFPELFAGSLQGFFGEIRRREPWIRALYLLRDNDCVFYDDGVQAVSREVIARACNPELKQIPDNGLHLRQEKELGFEGDRQLLVLKRTIAFAGAAEGNHKIVLALDIGAAFKSLFGKTHIGRGGFVALTVVAGSQRALFPSVEDSEIVSDLRSAFAASKDPGDLSRHVRESFLDVRPVAGTPFSIVGVASRNDLREPIWVLVETTAVVGIIFALLALLLGYRMVQRMTAPLLVLAEKVRQFSIGSKDIQCGINSDDEVGTLAGDFEEMAARLNSTYERMQNYSADLERVKGQLEVLLLATRGMAGSHTPFEAIDRAVLTAARQIKEYLPRHVICALLDPSHSDVLYQEAPLDLKPSAPQGETSTLSTRLEWHLTVPRPEVTTQLDRFLRGEKIEKDFHVEEHRLYLAIPGGERNLGAFCFETHASIESPEEWGDFLATLCRSLAIALQNIEYAENEAARSKEDERRRAEAEKRQLLDRIANAAHISDRLNSPLLTIFNVIEMLDKSYGNIADDSDEQTRYVGLNSFADSWRRLAPLLSESLSNVKAFRSHLDSLREVDHAVSVEPTGLLAKKMI